MKIYVHIYFYIIVSCRQVSLQENLHSSIVSLRKLLLPALVEFMPLPNRDELKSILAPYLKDRSINQIIMAAMFDLQCQDKDNCITG